MKKVIKFFRLLIGVIFIIPVIVVFGIVAFLVGIILRALRLKKLGDIVPTAILQPVVWWVMLFLGAKVKVIGKENLPPRGSSYCVIPNHNSALDIPAVFYTNRWPGSIAKKEAFKIPVINALMWLIHCVKIDRANPRDAIKAIGKGVENVKNGHPMMIFPEGTRSKTGEIGEFKAGSFKIATRSKCKVVPVVIKNTRQALEDAHYFGIVPVYVQILPAIDTATLTDEEIRALPQRVEDEIKKAYALLPSFPKKKK